MFHCADIQQILDIVAIFLYSKSRVHPSTALHPAGKSNHSLPPYFFFSLSLYLLGHLCVGMRAPETARGDCIRSHTLICEGFFFFFSLHVLNSWSVYTLKKKKKKS